MWLPREQPQAPPLRATRLFVIALCFHQHSRIVAANSVGAIFVVAPAGGRKRRPYGSFYSLATRRVARGGAPEADSHTTIAQSTCQARSGQEVGPHPWIAGVDGPPKGLAVRPHRFSAFLGARASSPLALMGAAWWKPALRRDRRSRVTLCLLHFSPHCASILPALGGGPSIALPV